MEIFRITHAQYANKLYASGNAARWNSAGNEVIYTAGSRSLACLENVVHRGARGLDSLFSVMVIYLPDALFIDSVNEGDLSTKWYELNEVPVCRQLGDRWLEQSRSVALKVPSAIIPSEANYLLNPAHANFDQVKLIATEGFRFDRRIKS